MSTTYTVYSQCGDVMATGLTAREAMSEILSDDSQEWRLRRNERNDVWVIETRQEVANIKWHDTLLISAADTEDEALDEIAAELLAVVNGWRYSPSVATDEQHQRWLAEAAADAMTEA